MKSIRVTRIVNQPPYHSEPPEPIKPVSRKWEPTKISNRKKKLLARVEHAKQKANPLQEGWVDLYIRQFLAWDEYSSFPLETGELDKNGDKLTIWVPFIRFKIGDSVYTFKKKRPVISNGVERPKGIEEKPTFDESTNEVWVTRTWKEFVPTMGRKRKRVSSNQSVANEYVKAYNFRYQKESIKLSNAPLKWGKLGAVVVAHYFKCKQLLGELSACRLHGLPLPEKLTPNPPKKIVVVQNRVANKLDF